MIPYVWDEAAFHGVSKEFLLFLLGKESIPYDITRINSVSSYGTFLGSLYFLFGDNPIIGKIISSILGSLVILMTYILSRTLKLSKKKSLLMSIIIAITPSYIIFSGLVMRDMLVWLLFYLFIYFVCHFFIKDKFKYLGFSLLTVIPLVLLRKQYAPLFAIYFIFIIMIIVSNKQYFFSKLNINPIKYYFLIFILLVGSYLTYSLVIYELMTWGNSKAELIEYFSSQMMYRAQGGSAYLQNIEFNSFFDIIWYIPLKFIYFVYGPFIWTAHNQLTFLASFENLLIWIFTFLLIKNVFKFKLIFQRVDRDIIIFLFFLVLSGLAANSIIDSNFGTAIRHRMIYMPILYILSLSIITHKRSIVK